MKILDIRINCRSAEAIYENSCNECELYFMKSPSVFSGENAEKVLSGRYIILFDSGSRKRIRMLGGRILKYDRISFRPLSAERQYALSMGIEFGVPYEINDDAVISSVIKNMKSVHGMKGKYNAEFMELSMRMLLITIGENIASSKKNFYRDVPHYAKLRAIRDMVYESPMLYWDIDEICSSMDISRTYFHRLYSEAFGVSFRKDVINGRIMYASVLLAETDMSVSEIAEKCGYESESYFMKQFRSHRGCTPTEYRRNSDREIPEILKNNKTEI